MPRYLFLCLALLISHINIALANEADSEAVARLNANSPLSASTLAETLLGLGLVIALILALAWLVKRSGKFQSTLNGDIKTLAGLSLGTREKAILLEVDGERILVGVTPHQINTLHVLGKSETPAPAEPKSDDKYQKFDQQLQKIIQQEQQND